MTRGAMYFLIFLCLINFQAHAAANGFDLDSQTPEHLKETVSNSLRNDDVAKVKSLINKGVNPLAVQKDALWHCNSVEMFKLVHPSEKIDSSMVSNVDGYDVIQKLIDEMASFIKPQEKRVELVGYLCNGKLPLNQKWVNKLSHESMYLNALVAPLLKIFLDAGCALDEKIYKNIINEGVRDFPEIVKEVNSIYKNYKNRVKNIKSAK